MWQLKVVRERTEPYGVHTRFRGAAEIHAGFKDYFAPLDREHFVVMCLDNKNHMAGFHVVSVGSVAMSIVHPREVFKVALLANASGIILMHNHPSGDPTPSTEDTEITRRLRQCAELFGMRLLDHVIFGDASTRPYVSMVDDGYW